MNRKYRKFEIKIAKKGEKIDKKKIDEKLDRI